MYYVLITFKDRSRSVLCTDDDVDCWTSKLTSEFVSFCTINTSQAGNIKILSYINNDIFGHAEYPMEILGTLR